MISKEKGYRLVMLLLMPCLFGLQVLWGQEKQRYIGPFKIGAYTGEADFSYQVKGQDTVFDGPFQIQRSNLNALLEGEDVSFLISGGFTENSPSGFWQFQFGEFKSDSASQVVDYQYRINVTGTQERTSGLMVDGKPDGPWGYSVQQIEESKVSKTLFNSNITFKNGVPQQSFKIESENGTLIGRFLRNGTAHDIWTWFSNGEEATFENWHFTEGWLQKIEKSVDGEIQTVTIYDGPVDNSKFINLDERFQKILKLKIPVNDTAIFLKGGISKLLTKNHHKYQKIDTILSKLGESRFMPEFKVQVPHFPLDSIQIRQLDSIQALQQRSNAISHFFLKDTQLNLLKRSDVEAQFLYAVIQTLSHKFLNPLEKLVSYHKLDALSFLYRVNLFERLFPEGMPSTKMVVEFGEDSKERRTFEGPGVANFNYGRYDLQSAYQMAQYAHSSLDSIAGVLKIKLANEKRHQAFVALEEEMIDKADLLNMFLDSTTNSPNTSYTKALENIKQVAEQSLAKYAAMKENEGKGRAAQQLVICLESLDALARTVAALPERDGAIEVKYQDAVWNPFTATIMNEEVKKRITMAYRNILVPHFLEKVASDLSCDTAANLNFLMNNTYQRMLQLRDEDTSKLERKLKREKNPRTIMELFSLKPLEKDN